MSYWLSSKPSVHLNSVWENGILFLFFIFEMRDDVQSVSTLGFPFLDTFGKSGTTSSHSSPAITMYLVLLTRCFNLAQNGEKQLLEKTTDISGWRPWRSVPQKHPAVGKWSLQRFFGAGYVILHESSIFEHPLLGNTLR